MRRCSVRSGVVGSVSSVCDRWATVATTVAQLIVSIRAPICDRTTSSNTATIRER